VFFTEGFSLVAREGIPAHQFGLSVSFARPIGCHRFLSTIFAASDFLFWRRTPISTLEKLVVPSRCSHRRLGSDAELWPPSSSVLAAQTLRSSA
jgi:hypothetical protein